MNEFQNYHLDRYERLKDGIMADKSALNAAQKALRMSSSKDTDTRVEELEWKIEDAESKMQLYEKRLRWIEQQRITIATERAGAKPWWRKRRPTKKHPHTYLCRSVGEEE